jgi:hypothetical protein
MNENKEKVSLQQLQTAPASTQQLSAFTSIAGFELVQRMAQGLMTASLIPTRYQQSIGDTMIAINMAQRLRCDPLMVMQNLYVVHNTPAWSGQFVIAAINQSGMFKGPLRFIEVGTRDTMSWGFYAEATSKDDHVIKGPTVTIQLAKNEGWISKNPKWTNMPEMMLRYRAGSWFGRTECPELLMGFQTAEEVNDIIDFDPNTGEIIHETTQAPPAPIKAEVLQKAAKPRPDTVVSEQVVEGANKMTDEDWAGEDAEPETVTPKQDGAKQEERHELPPSNDEQLKAHGWYEDGNRKFNVHGEIWTPDAHATGRGGDPIVNTDGHFRMRRGGALPGTEVEVSGPQAPDSDPVDDGTNQEAPTPGYKKEPEFIDGADGGEKGQDDWMEGLE